MSMLDAKVVDDLTGFLSLTFQGFSKGVSYVWS